MLSNFSKTTQVFGFGKTRCFFNLRSAIILHVTVFFTMYIFVLKGMLLNFDYFCFVLKAGVLFGVIITRCFYLTWKVCIIIIHVTVFLTIFFCLFLK